MSGGGDLPSRLPTPLALATLRLEEERRGGNAFAVLFALRDAVECHLRLLAAVGLAERLAAAGGNETALRAVAEDHLSPILGKLPSLGDWVGVVRGLGASEPAISAGRTRDGLRKIVLSSAWRLLFEGSGDFVSFRNRTLGHGAYRADAELLSEAGAYSTPLAELTATSEEALWGSVFVEAAGSIWRGAEPRRIAEGSPPESWTSARLRFEEAAAGTDFSLDPLVRAHWDPESGAWDLLLFSDLRWNGRTPASARAHFLDYWRGRHRTERPFHPVVERYLRFVSFRQGRMEIGGDQRSPASFGLAAPLRVAHLMRPLVKWAGVALRRPDRGGYARLVGPAGSGKSWFLLDAMRWSAGPDDPEEIQESLLHLPAPRLCRFLYNPARDGASPEAFWGSLARQAQQLRLHVGDPGRLSGGRDLGQWARDLFDLNPEVLRASFLLLVIDGLDELPDRAARDRRLTAWLTPLPPRCAVVLASRPELPRKLEEDLIRVERQTGEPLPVLVVDPEGEENLRLQRFYLAKQLPELDEEQREQVLRASEGIFLFTHQFARALQLGALRAGEPLPAREALHGQLLADLRKRTGDDLFRRVHLRLLAALVGAREPLTATALGEHWGLPAGALPPALSDLDFLLTAVRGEGTEERYAIAHGLVRERLGREPEVMAEIGTAQTEYAARVGQELGAYSSRGGLWRDIDPVEDASFAYALLHLRWHLTQIGQVDRAASVARDPAYRHALREAARTFRQQGEFGRAESFWRALLDVEEALGKDEPQLRLAFAQDLVAYVEHLNAVSRVDRAVEAAKSAERIGEELGDRRLAGIALMRAGYACYLGGRSKQARILLDRALPLLETSQANALEISEARLYRAEVHYYYDDDADAAEALCQELIAVAEQHRDRVLRAKIGHLRGRVFYSVDRTAEAVQELEAAGAVFAELGMAVWETDILNFLTDPYLDLGRVPEALESASRARTGYRRYGDLIGAMEAAWGLGKVHLELGHLSEAELWFREQKELAANVDPATPCPAINLGRVLVRQGRLDEARTLIGEAQPLARAREYRLERADLAELERELRAAEEGPPE